MKFLTILTVTGAGGGHPQLLEGGVIEFGRVQVVEYLVGVVQQCGRALVAAC